VFADAAQNQATTASVLPSFFLVDSGNAIEKTLQNPESAN
jgi:hypothetical protein